MAKERNYEWMELWAAWKTQPLYIRQGWMTGKGTHGCYGLKPILTEFMDNYPREIQDEVFQYAPVDVQEYFGYVPKVEEKKEMKKSLITWSNSFVSPELRKKLNNIMEA